MIFDTHTHYDDEAYSKDRDKLLRDLPEAGINRICNIGSSFFGATESLRLAKNYDFIYAAVGIHPNDTCELDEGKFTKIREMAGNKKAVAIGEIGLDYHGYDTFPGKPSREHQVYWFERQLNLAIELEKPVVIHSRNAAEDTLNMIEKAVNRGLRGGIIHCFSYSSEIALRYVEMGFYIGFGGSLTYKGQKKISKALQAITIEKAVLETDCPYLTPMPIRAMSEGHGTGFIRNSSLNIPYIRDKIAEILSISPEVVERTTWENANKIYNLT